MTVKQYLQELKTQRWDDHRYYHHSRINQTLHLISALSFLASYALLFKDPAEAALLAWGVSMISRQSGHFFFEPRGYDEVNQATDEYKEEIKVGYNIRRKLVLMALWVAAPVILYFAPGLGGYLTPAASWNEFWHQVGWAWLVVGVGGLLFRTVHLFFIKDVMSGLVWMSKIITDPVHDVLLYWKSPFYLLRGQLIDPMDHARHG